MFQIAINNIELDKNNISKLRIVEDIENIFPELHLIFQETDGIFSELNPIINGSTITLTREEDNAIELFKITNVKDISSKNMQDNNTHSKYRVFEIKAIYLNAEKNLYSAGLIYNKNSNSESILRDIVENQLSLRLVVNIDDNRLYNYYTLKTNHISQLKMLLEQINDSWKNKNAVLFYTLFSNTITLADITKLLEKKNAFISLDEKTSLADSDSFDYSIPNQKSISSYDFENEIFENYSVGIDFENINNSDIVIYNNCIDIDLNNTKDMFLKNNKKIINLSFNGFEYSLGRAVEKVYDNPINEEYPSTNPLKTNIYCIVKREIIISSKGSGIQIIEVVNPFLKNK